MLISILVTVLVAWLSSIEVRIRRMSEKQIESPTREEVEHTIDTKQESVKVLQQELKEDCKRIEEKLDKLVDKLT